MTLPNHLGAYEFEIKHFDLAVDDPTGIRVHYGAAYADAKKFQLRLHQARALDRQQSRRLYPSTDMRAGSSIYDPLVVTVREDVSGDWWVYIKRQKFDETKIESLSQLEGEFVQIENQPSQLLIEDNTEESSDA